MKHIREPRGKQHTSRTSEKVSQNTKLKRELKNHQRKIEQLLVTAKQLQSEFNRLMCDLENRETRVAVIQNELELLKTQENNRETKN